jgi:hypothetical protein
MDVADFHAGHIHFSVCRLLCAKPQRAHIRTLSPFHLSVPVINLADTRRFYGELAGCAEGRSAERRIDWNFFGHHLVTRVEPDDASHKTTDVDSFGVMTPCRHFGVVISQEDWQRQHRGVQGLSTRALAEETLIARSCAAQA